MVDLRTYYIINGSQKPYVNNERHLQQNEFIINGTIQTLIIIKKL